MKAKSVTITQVAKHAGVSIGTVSHILNGTAPISRETTNRVYAAIKELNYTPNIMAKSLRSKKNYTIGLMIPNLNNSFHSKVTSVFVDRAYELGYDVQIHGYEYSLERERRELARLEGNNIGTVVIFNGHGDEAEIQNFQKKGIPVILADRSTDMAGVHYVEYDNYTIMCDLIRMLKERGYQRIGFFSEPLFLTNLKDRYRGYQDGLKQYGYPFNPDHVFVKEELCLDNLKNGYMYMKEILQTHEKNALPDVWIASSDLLAIGIMRAFDELGYRIPEDFAVVGFDNIEISGYMNPRLTTVHQDQTALGEALMKMVKDVNDGKTDIQNITLAQTLIIRESC